MKIKLLDARLADARRRMRAVNTDFDSLAVDFAEAIRLLRELREAVKAEKVLTSRKYVGMALAISHLLDRFPPSGGTERG